jgi:phosphatidylglycerophosphatase C
VKKLALFDFCETIINLQTADAYINYLYNNSKSLRSLSIEIVRLLLKNSRLLYGLNHKQFQLLQIKGLLINKVSTLTNQFVNDILNQNILEKSLLKLQEHQDKGHHVIVVSGGFTPYIKEFMKNYNVNDVIATDLETIGNQFTGKIDGLNCMGTNKLIKLKQYINTDEYDLKNSYAYSDSKSDLPLLQFVGNGYAVNNGQNNTVWAKKYKMPIFNA